MNVIEMAREAGFENSEYGLNCTPGMYAYNMGIVERFAALVRAQALEEAADTCERLGLSQNSEWEAGTLDCAAAIRALKEQA